MSDPVSETNEQQRVVSAPVRSYAVWLVPHEDWARNIVAVSGGKAKTQFLRDLDLDGVDYLDVRCKVQKGFVTDDEFKRTAEYRGVPFARIGMRVEVGCNAGVIVGKNSSANFNVLFDGDDSPLNCHPSWKFKYFDDDGSVLADYTNQEH